MDGWIKRQIGIMDKDGWKMKKDKRGEKKAKGRKEGCREGGERQRWGEKGMERERDRREEGEKRGREGRSGSGARGKIGTRKSRHSGQDRCMEKQMQPKMHSPPRETSRTEPACPTPRPALPSPLHPARDCSPEDTGVSDTLFAHSLASDINSDTGHGPLLKLLSPKETQEPGPPARAGRVLTQPSSSGTTGAERP